MVRCGRKYVGRQAHSKRSALPYPASTNYRKGEYKDLVAVVISLLRAKTQDQSSMPRRYRMVATTATVLQPGWHRLVRNGQTRPGEPPKTM